MREPAVATENKISKLFRTTTFRLSVLFLIIYGLAAVIAIGYVYWNTNVLLIRQLNQTVEAEIQGLAEQYRQGGISLLSSTVAERSLAPGNSVYLVTDSQGRHIAGNLKNISRQLWNTVGDVRFSFRRQLGNGEPETRQAFAKAFRLPEGFRLIVGRDIEDRRIFEHVMSSVWWGLGLMAFVGLGGGWLVSRNLLSRIDTVTATSQAIMQGNLSERIPVRGSGDELDRLSINLNTMLEKIERLMTGLRDVSDNIAHDLKTPLNRLRNRVEAALRDQRGEMAYKEALETTIEEADALIKTFNALLNIAQMEAGASLAESSTINLSTVMQDIAELYEPVLEEHEMSLKTELSNDVQVRADRQLLGQAVTNLLDNAIKYARTEEGNGKEKHVITLGLQQTNSHAKISVADHGPGIADQDHKRVLQRFVRLEESRSQPGSGLGLSLVAAVAHAHNGKVYFEDNNPGLRAIIEIPLINSTMYMRKEYSIL